MCIRDRIQECRIVNFITLIRCIIDFRRYNRDDFIILHGDIKLVIDVGILCGCIAPVSYTHLDVYKRQEKDLYVPLLHKSSEKEYPVSYKLMDM